LLATLGVMVVAAAPAVAAPTANFSFSPTTPTVNQVVTFTPSTTPDTAPLTTADWDFQNDGVLDTPVGGVPALQGVTHAYPQAGTFQVRMVARDFLGAQDSIIKSIRVNAPPVAQFSFSPTAPVAGQEVLFQSFSYDPDGTSLSYAWDTDGDGFDDGTGSTVSRTFTTPGSKQVRLQVTDSDGVSAPSGATVTVAPAPASPLPVAQFSVTPPRPRVGQQVSLRSYSYDPDGSIVSQRWDLDGDGDFEENFTGKTAFTVFPKAGERIVRLEVRDSDGGVQTETQNITVTRAPAAGLSLINPFPVARLAGSVYPGGARVRLLEVRTPPRSRVVVRCAGKSCPDKKITKTSKRKPVRFKGMTRFLRAGTILKVSIRKGREIGKYTRWLIRGGKLPKRKDLCLYPGKKKGKRCPSVGS
jgi:PKD repeat protein